MKFADNWLAPNPGSDAAIAQAMTHVILQEHYVNQPNERFINYAETIYRHAIYHHVR